MSRIRPNAISKRIALTAVITAVTLVSGCGLVVQHKVGDAIAAALPKVIGPADSYAVNVIGSTDSLLRGHIPEIQIHGTNVHLGAEIEMATLDIDAQQISVNTRSKQLESIKSLTFAGTMNQAQVDQYLNRTDDPDRPPNLTITLYDHDIHARFSYKEFGVSLPVTVDGNLAIANGCDEQIDFVPSKANAIRIGIPRKILEYAAKRINPVIDLTDISVPVHLRQVGIVGHTAMFSGEAQLPPAAIAEGRRVASGQ